MAKKKQPAPKRGGKKKVAPKKAAKSKPIPQQVAEQSARKRAAGKASALPRVDVSEHTRRGTVEEQWAAEVESKPGLRGTFITSHDDRALKDICDRTGTRYIVDRTCALPASPPTTKRSKFWRQYQDTETGKFIGWRAAAKLTKDKVISRLRLRKGAR